MRNLRNLPWWQYAVPAAIVLAGVLSQERPLQRDFYAMAGVLMLAAMSLLALELSRRAVARVRRDLSLRSAPSSRTSPGRNRESG